MKDCMCCDSTLIFTATDDKEVYRCSVCGLPYYVEWSVPACKPSWITGCRKFWNERRSQVMPADYGMLYIKHDGTVSSYSAPESVIELWNKHMECGI